MELEPGTMAHLQRQRRPMILREASSSAHLVSALEHDPTATEVVILGEDVGDPLRLVHHVRALDEDLAVMLMARGVELARYREAIRFLPSLRGDVTCLDAGASVELTPLVHDAAQRTQRRRMLRVASATTLPMNAEPTRAGPLLARILDHCPVGMVALDARGRVQLCNAAALKALGASERELVGRPLVLLFREDDWEELSSFLACCAATERALPKVDFRLRLASGHERVLQLSATPFPGSRGEQGTLVFLEDASS